MTPRLQKFALLAHISFSVGWFGAVVPYLALAIAGLVSDDALTVRAAFLSMELIGWFVIVPLSFAALLSGLVQSLGTRWGLLRHWWIVAKLALTVFAVIILFHHMQEVSQVARMARQMSLSSTDLRPELIHAGGGLLVLLATMVLSVFKPWGMTAYGQRRAARAYSPIRLSGEAAVRELALATSRSRWARIAWISAIHAIAVVLVLVIVLHISAGGIRHH